MSQVNIYKSRLAYVHSGSTLVATTIVFFICTNLASSLGLIWPNFKLFPLVVVGGMLLGMLTLAGSFVTDLLDNMWKRRELDTELADFDRLMAKNPGNQAKTSFRNGGSVSAPRSKVDEHEAIDPE